MRTQPTEPTENNETSVTKIILALSSALLPSVFVIGMFAFFKGRNVPSVVLVGECILCLACCAVPSLLLFRRHPTLALVIALIFIPLNGIISFFFGCTAVLAASS
jgi:hypothetical protein